MSSPAWPPTSAWQWALWIGGSMGTLSAAIGSAYVIWSKLLAPLGGWLFRPFRKSWIRFLAVLTRLENLADADVTEQIAHQSAQLSRIEKELKPNGGASLADRVCRIEERQLRWERSNDALIEDSSQGVFECSPDGRNIKVNRTYCRGVGASDKSELMGFGWKNFVHPDHAPGYHETWTSAFGDQRDIETSLVFRHAISGEPVTAHVRVYMVPHPTNDEPALYVGTIDFLEPNSADE